MYLVKSCFHSDIHDLYTAVQMFRVNTSITLTKTAFIYITFMILADAFIQSNLQYIQVIHLYCQYVCPGNRTHNLCAANAML